MAGDRRFSMISEARTAMVPVPAAYQPEKLYLQELPPLERITAAEAAGKPLADSV